MKRLTIGLLLITLSVLWPLHSAHAGAFACSITSVSAINLIYVPTAAAPLVASGTVSIGCSKGGSNSDTRYLEVAVDQGLYSSGSGNRAANGAARLNYSLWRDTTTTAAWGDTATTRIAATVTSTTSTSITLNWAMSVAALQPAVAGAYSDTATVRLYQGTSANPALTDQAPTVATLPITLTVNTQCSLSSLPGNIQFNYTSFQPVAANAGTSFAVTCTNGAPYSVALDATTGTLLGLNYQLQLSVAGTQTGTGVPQSVGISGTMAGGQAGTCASGICTGTQTRVLTVSY